MAYRFDNTANAWVQFANAPFNGYTFGGLTSAVFLRRATAGSSDYWIYFSTSGLSDKLVHHVTTNTHQLFGGTDVFASGTISSTSIWYLLVATRAAGSSTVRFHLWDGTSWTHANQAGNTFSNVTIGATDLFYLGAPFAGVCFGGDLVCAGVKKSDSTDLQVETLSPTLFSAWQAFGFDWLVGCQLVGALQDLGTPGTGDETGRGSGVSLVSDPAGWTWAAPAVTPVANFTGTPLTGLAPLSVAFTDTSTNTPTSWAWTFGDGGTSSSQNPTHSYTVPGVYTVTLVATNTAGSDTKTRVGYVAASETIIYVAGGGIEIY